VTLQKDAQHVVFELAFHAVRIRGFKTQPESWTVVCNAQLHLATIHSTGFVHVRFCVFVGVLDLGYTVWLWARAMWL